MRTRAGVTGIVLASPVVLIAVLGPFLPPYAPDAFVTGRYAAPSAGHILGGDDLGRDVLSRVLAGGWMILLLAFAATVLGVLIGALAGIAAGYYPGWRDNLIMRVVDVFLAFPDVIFAILLLSVLGPQPWLIVVAVALTHAPRTARVFRSAAMAIVDREFITARRLNGVSSFRIIRSDILPNLTAPLSVEAGLRLPWSITIIASLSFLGVGLPAPAPNWGTMINENMLGITANVWPILAPALLIAVLVIGLNLIGDSLALTFGSVAGVGEEGLSLQVGDGQATGRAMELESASDSVAVGD